MTTSLEVDKESRVAIVCCSGVLQREDALRAAEALWTAADWAGESVVWDFRRAEFDLSGSDVRGIASFVLERQPERPPAKIAFVTARDADYGLARMFEVYRDDPNTVFHAFRDYEEALEWARSPDSGAD